MSITLKKTKSVIFAAYKDLLAKNQVLENALAAAERGGSTTPAVTKTVIKEVHKVASPDDLNGLISMLNSVEDGIGKAVGTFSAKQVVEAESLEEIQAKIKDGKTQLQELYDIEMEDDSVDKVIDDYEAVKEKFNTDLDDKKTTFDDEYSEKSEEWKAEKENNYLEVREKKAAVSLDQKREKEEVEYNLKQERALETDNYKQKGKALQEELDDLKEAKEEEMAAKEKEVEEREFEFEDYLERYNELPTKKADAIKKAEEEAIGIIKREARIKANMMAKEIETKNRSNSFRIKNLQDTIKKQDAQIAKYSTQLSETLKQAQILAMKALEGAASNDSLDAIKAIAMEQAKHSSKK